jgi:hypothetical protein
MRAHEFINEAKFLKTGALSKVNQYATRGLHLYADAPDPKDGDYTMYRLMMALASTDGDNTKKRTPADSWIGRYHTAHPYTKEEAEMLKQAYKEIGAHWKDINDGNMESGELDSTSVVSPIKPFKGYTK